MQHRSPSLIPSSSAPPRLSIGLTPQSNALLPASAGLQSGRIGYPYPSEPLIHYPTSSMMPGPSVTGSGFGLYQKPPDISLRSFESIDTPLDQHRKRPSMLSNFGTSGQHLVVPPEPVASKRLRVDRIEQDAGSPASSARSMMQSDSALRKEPTYLPQVENISPTPDDQGTTAGTSDRDRILEMIAKMDREIAVAESDLKRLKKQEQELLESAQHHGDTVATSTTAHVANGVDAFVSGQSLIERIYAENRRNAAIAHEKFAKLWPANLPSTSSPDGTIIRPSYKEPSELPSFQLEKVRYAKFKPRLILHLKRLREAERKRQLYLTERYDQNMLAWKKKVERLENSAKRKQRDAKLREVFEKTFPELKKQREEREKTGRLDSRSGILSAARSGAQPDAPQEGTQTEAAQEVEEETSRAMLNAVEVPLTTLDPSRRSRYQFINNNGLVQDPLIAHQERQTLFQIVWSADEKKTFKEKFMQYGKNFAAIATFLERKNTKDCIQYYYLTKKREKYKQLLRSKYRKKGPTGRMYKPPVMPLPQQPKSEDTTKEEAEGSSALAATNEPEYNCVICKTKIDSNNGGRPLTRACYEHYGLDQDVSTADLRICQKCYLSFVRKKHSYVSAFSCPVGTCATIRRKVKPTRPLPPPKWIELTTEQQQLLVKEFQIGSDTSKCCNGCFKRLTRRVDMLLTGGAPATTVQKPGVVSSSSAAVSAEALAARWSEEELVALRVALAKHGTDRAWVTIAVDVRTKTASDCARFFEENRDRLLADVLLLHQEKAAAAAKVQAPGIESEDDDEREAAPLALAVPPTVPPPVVCVSVADVIASTERKERERTWTDNDSNTTLSADEETATVSHGLFLGKQATARALDSGSTGKHGGALSPESLPVALPPPKPKRPYKPKASYCERMEREKQQATLKEVIDSAIMRSVIKVETASADDFDSMQHTAAACLMSPSRGKAPIVIKSELPSPVSSSACASPSMSPVTRAKLVGSTASVQQQQISRVTVPTAGTIVATTGSISQGTPLRSASGACPTTTSESQFMVQAQMRPITPAALMSSRDLAVLEQQQRPASAGGHVLTGGGDLLMPTTRGLMHVPSSAAWTTDHVNLYRARHAELMKAGFGEQQATMLCQQLMRHSDLQQGQQQFADSLVNQHLQQQMLHQTLRHFAGLGGATAMPTLTIDSAAAAQVAMLSSIQQQQQQLMLYEQQRLAALAAEQHTQMQKRAFLEQVALQEQQRQRAIIEEERKVALERQRLLYAATPELDYLRSPHVATPILSNSPNLSARAGSVSSAAQLQHSQMASIRTSVLESPKAPVTPGPTVRTKAAMKELPPTLRTEAASSSASLMDYGRRGSNTSLPPSSRARSPPARPMSTLPTLRSPSVLDASKKDTMTAAGLIESIITSHVGGQAGASGASHVSQASRPETSVQSVLIPPVVVPSVVISAPPSHQLLMSAPSSASPQQKQDITLIKRIDDLVNADFPSPMPSTSRTQLLADTVARVAAGEAGSSGISPASFTQDLEPISYDLEPISPPESVRDISPEPINATVTAVPPLWQPQWFGAQRGTANEDSEASRVVAALLGSEQRQEGGSIDQVVVSRPSFSGCYFGASTSSNSDRPATTAAPVMPEFESVSDDET